VNVNMLDGDFLLPRASIAVERFQQHPERTSLLAWPKFSRSLLNRNLSRRLFAADCVLRQPFLPANPAENDGSGVPGSLAVRPCAEVALLRARTVLGGSRGACTCLERAYRAISG
jgi:hypothetical protein